MLSCCTFYTADYVVFQSRLASRSIVASLNRVVLLNYTRLWLNFKVRRSSADALRRAFRCALMTAIKNLGLHQTNPSISRRHVSPRRTVAGGDAQKDGVDVFHAEPAATSQLRIGTTGELRPL